VIACRPVMMVTSVTRVRGKLEKILKVSVLKIHYLCKHLKTDWVLANTWKVLELKVAVFENRTCHE